MAEMLAEKLGKCKPAGADQIPRQTLKSGSEVLILIFCIKKIAPVDGTVHKFTGL